MKWNEQEFTNLGFGTLAHLTKAKYNKLHSFLPMISDDDLKQYYASRDEIQDELRNEVAVQKEFQKQVAEKKLLQVSNNVIV